MAPSQDSRIQVLSPETPGASQVLTPEALALVADLALAFGPKIAGLLARRREAQARFDAGERPGFLAETARIREADWSIGEIPEDVRDRRVEITGPVDRKMIINALSSGANVFMADFEDSTAPSFANVLAGQQNLADAVRGTISFVDPKTGKSYALPERTAVLMVRPRGLHLPEKHVTVGGAPVPASLFDFGLFLFHNHAALREQKRRPYFYLPKLESHKEARLWNDVFSHAEKALGMEPGTIKATVLIETLPAAFEMDEILFELREHVLGLNCGRWDYIFSFIKKMRAHPGFVLPDRAEVTMEQPFLKAYTELLVKTCHRRGAHAMGGMAAQIPIKGDPAANEAALAKVRADKLREVKGGHDGTWVAHPGLIPIAREIFDEHMPGPNQIENKREDVSVTAEDLLRVPSGTRTEEGLRHNIRVGVQYLEAWIGGLGCVPLYHLMEDAATAEIARAQAWQWLRHGADVGGARLTPERFEAALSEEVSKLEKLEPGAPRPNLEKAAALFRSLCLSPDFEEFLTFKAYELLTRGESARTELGGEARVAG